jgi:hypothetical protein
MPTVPTYGDDDDGTGGIPKELQPGPQHILMAAAIYMQRQEQEMQPRVPAEELARGEESAKLHMLASADAVPAAPSFGPHSPPPSRSPSAVRMLRARR